MIVSLFNRKTKSDLGWAFVGFIDGGLEQHPNQHPPDQAVMTLHVTDDLFLRSFNLARVQPGMPLPVD